MIRLDRFLIIFAIGFALCWWITAIVDAHAERDPGPIYRSVLPTNCTTWYALTQGYGPTINGIDSIWQCTDLPDGYVISLPGVH